MYLHSSLGYWLLYDHVVSVMHGKIDLVASACPCICVVCVSMFFLDFYVRTTIGNFMDRHADAHADLIGF